MVLVKLVPQDVLFSQRYVGFTFRNGYNLADSKYTIGAPTKDGEFFLASETPSVIKDKNGKYTSIDNRRLFMLKYLAPTRPTYFNFVIKKKGDANLDMKFDDQDWIGKSEITLIETGVIKKLPNTPKKVSDLTPIIDDYISKQNKSQIPFVKSGTPFAKTIGSLTLDQIYEMKRTYPDELFNKYTPTAGIIVNKSEGMLTFLHLFLTRFKDIPTIKDSVGEWLGYSTECLARCDKETAELVKTIMKKYRAYSKWIKTFEPEYAFMEVKNPCLYTLFNSIACNLQLAGKRPTAKDVLHMALHYGSANHLKNGVIPSKPKVANKTLANMYTVAHYCCNVKLMDSFI